MAQKTNQPPTVSQEADRPGRRCDGKDRKIICKFVYQQLKLFASADFGWLGWSVWFPEEIDFFTKLLLWSNIVLIFFSYHHCWLFCMVKNNWYLTVLLSLKLTFSEGFWCKLFGRKAISSGLVLRRVLFLAGLDTFQIDWRVPDCSLCSWFTSAQKWNLISPLPNWYSQVFVLTHQPPRFNRP